LTRARGGVLFAGLASLLLLIGCDSRKTVVVYSPHAKPILLQFERAFEAVHPDVDVVWLYIGSQACLERIRAERHNPQASIWWGGDSTGMETAAAEGLLQPYEPTYATPTLPRHPENLWTSCFYLPIVIGYHPDRIAAADLPKRFADLGDARFKGRIVLRDPAPSGTMRTFIAGILSRSIVETGGEEAGFDLLGRIHANVHHYDPSPEMLFETLEHGPPSLSVWLLTDFVFQRREKGYHFLAAGLDEPVPVVLDCIALVKGPSGATPEARAFYEFVNTLESMEIFAREHARIPVRADFDQSKLLDDIRAVPVKPMEVDRALVKQKTPVWMRRFEEEVKR
jgi:iron(III) transport system substrate-binding protein